MKHVRMHLYPVYERVWHWVQALAILLLLWTGLCIHNPEYFLFFSFQTAITLHNLLGFIVLGNAIFGMFYYWTTGTIQQYLPQPHGFLILAVRQIMYYTSGIFRDEPHPLEKSPKHRLNPLQQATYLIILNVLLPIQLVTGMLMWSGQTWPEAVLSVGGIQTLAMVHGLCAWLFATFVVAHIYLTTTGHTPLANIKAMIFGYEDVPVEHTGDASLKPTAGQSNASS